jgi:hypothetical protein
VARIHRKKVAELTENCNILYLLIVHLMICAVRINSFDLYVLYNMMVLLQDH